MRLRRSIKFDFIIYSCLIGAAILLTYSAKSYFASLDNFSGVKNEVISALKEAQNKEEEVIVEEAPKEEVKLNIDEKDLISTYLNLLRDNIKKDEIISYEMIKSWNNFEVIDTQYVREITSTYYSYSFILKIDNNNPLLGNLEKNELSDEENIYISLIANIVVKDDNSYVKFVEILKNS